MASSNPNCRIPANAKQGKPSSKEPESHFDSTSSRNGSLPYTSFCPIFLSVLSFCCFLSPSPAAMSILGISKVFTVCRIPTLLIQEFHTAVSTGNIVSICTKVAPNPRKFLWFYHLGPSKVSSLFLASCIWSARIPFSLDHSYLYHNFWQFVFWKNISGLKVSFYKGAFLGVFL